MKRIFSILWVCAIAASAMAVPARRGWSSRTQADGTTIEVQTIGDEFYHYTINHEGQEVRLNAAGMYEAVGAEPTAEVFKARRAQGQARRARKDVGVDPYPAPRGLLILANFSDVKYKAANSADVMDSLINAKDCQVNGGFGSAAQYFIDQSDGQYQPIFDVYGPIELSKTQAYYGGNEGTGDNAQDSLATDAVIEACIIANEQYPELNFADYDWNGDGYVDFVYVIYAGKGEADGGSANTIWPHNYSIQEIVKYYQYGWSKYRKSDTKLDNVYLDNYAMSQEIDGQTGKLAGNGTFCHEFGHVIGLPDFYDTSYGTNYQKKKTPNEWDVMDGGPYNGDGHCPPNYSAWEKYFMGWITPENLGDGHANLTLYPNGTEQYNVYQLNTSSTLESATQEGLNYYIECRQQEGWDTYLPAEGMLIWKVNFKSSLWIANGPNLSSSGAPHYTLDIPSGSRIGEDYGKKNAWPYSTINSWSALDIQLTDIARDGKNITLTYNDNMQAVETVVDSMGNGQTAQKRLKNGQVVILRGDKEYNIIGVRLQ